MKKVTNIDGYRFNSPHYKKYDDTVISNKKAVMQKLLDEKIKRLEVRLSELKEAKEFLMTGKQIYLIRDNNFNYSYVDAKYNYIYKYEVINGKPVLIDTNSNLFEIIEYVELNDIGQDTGDRKNIVSWIDKIVKVKKIDN